MGRLQINLLPDVKLDYVKHEKNRNLIMTICTVLSAVALIIFVVMFSTVYIVQKKQLSNADQAITQAKQQLQAVPNINQVLTVQNQLNTLAQLHSSKHIMSRIFSYLQQVTPAKASVNSISIDSKSNSIQLSGTADSAKTINVYIDTLKLTSFTPTGQNTPHQAFVSVIETSYSISSGQASYALTVTYDPLLLSNSTVDSGGNPTAPTLVVPKQTTTRYNLNDLSSVFNGQPKGAQ